MKHSAFLIILAGLAGLASPGAAQDRPGDADLAACVAAADGRREAEATAAARRAAAAFRARIERSATDHDARIGYAQVKSRCEIPFVPLMTQAVLIEEANKALGAVLAADSANWRARFLLGVHHFRTPRFLGRTPDAIAQFEILRRQQGNRTDHPDFALTYVYLGDLYERQERTEEARATWATGARLFPDNPELQQKIRQQTPRAPGAAHDSTPGTSTSRAPNGGRPVVLDALVADGGSRLDDAHSPVAVRRIDIYMTPGGTADLMHSLQTLPGVTRAGDGVDLYVRGGDPAESPVFIDGARLFYAGRFESVHGGVFGVLDPGVIRNAYFSSGGFSARYGDALSGVLDVETVGRPSAAMTRLHVNTTSAQVALDRPLGSSAGIWASARVTETSLMLALHGRGGEYAEKPRSAEGIAGASWAPSDQLTLRLTGMTDTDAVARVTNAYGHRGPFSSSGGSSLLALSGRWLSAGGNAAIRGSISGTRRESELAFGVLNREQTEHGASARLDADHTVGETHVRTGFEVRSVSRQVAGTVPTTSQLGPGAPSEVLERHTEESGHVGAYAEAERPLGERVSVVAGLRADRLPGETAWSADPRAAFAFRASTDWTLRLAAGVFHQGGWRGRYRVSDPGAPEGTPRRADHLAAAAERGGDPSVRLEAYWKRYGDYAATGTDQPQIRGGRAAGLDAIVRWEGQRPLKGWITYSFLDGRIRLDDGRTTPARVDVTHTLTGVARYSFLERWEVGGTARLATGRPFTPLAGVEAGEPPIPSWGDPYSDRLPTYRRLDVRLTRFIPGRRAPGVVYAEILNVLDTPNVTAYTHSADYSSRQRVESFFADRTIVVGTTLNF
jgi:tetratricopeptide (TPR) repeat protein